MNDMIVSFKISAEDVAHIIVQGVEGMLETLPQLTDEEKHVGLFWEVPNELFWKDPEAASSVVSLKRKRAEKNNECFICFGEYQQARSHPVMLEALEKAHAAGYQVDVDATWLMVCQKVARDEPLILEKGEACLLAELKDMIGQNIVVRLTPLHVIEEEKGLPPLLQSLDDILA